MEHNPYAPPAAPIADVADSYADAEVASRLRRFLNFLIDVCGYFTLSMLLGVLLALIAPSTLPQLEHLGLPGNYLFGIVVMSAYYMPFELIFGRTPGKLITGTRVIAESGETPTFQQILGRTLARF